MCVENRDCGQVMFGEFGQCMFLNACDDQGKKARPKYVPRCDRGQCLFDEQTDMADCTIPKEGMTCAPEMIVTSPMCNYNNDDCLQQGWRDVKSTTYTCKSAICEPVETLTQDPSDCMRSTENVPCPPFN